MIEITPSLSVGENEIQYEFIRASGPGGQNINKVATGVQLRFDIRNSPSLEEGVKERLIKLSGSRVTADGVLILEAKRFRTQEQNRADALARLAALIYRAAEKPKPRKKTRPGAAAVEERLEKKRRQSAVKRMRRYRPGEPE